jgi:uncharacterized protein YbjT (DUF2867 family)
VQLDFDKPETLGPALRGVETLFLLSTTVAPEADVAREAKAAGVKRIVKLSVLRAAREEFIFARWHRAAEQAIEASGVPWTFLRPGSFMQNVVNYMGDTIRSQNAIYTAAPDAPVAHIDARDIGAVAARVLSEAGHEGKAYELAGPEAPTYRDVAALLSRALGREIRVVAISDEDHRRAAIGAGAPEPYADALVDLERFYRTGKAGEVVADLQKMLGRPPGRFDAYVKDEAAAALQGPSA